MTQIGAIESDYPYDEPLWTGAVVSTTNRAGHVGLCVAEANILATSMAATHMSPDLARELAVRILDAADVAEQEAAGREVAYRQLEVSFERQG